MRSCLHTVPAPVLLQLAATLYLQNASCSLPCRSDVGKQRDFGRLMHEAPIFALRLMQMSLEKGAPKKRQMPKEADGEDKKQKKK